MSSIFNAMCVSHDPVIISDTDEKSWAAAITQGRAQHPHCDLLIGRWSGGLVEVCCPGSETHPGRHPGWHRDDVVADARLLALAAVMVQPGRDTDALQQRALSRLPSCWTPLRLRRIAVQLGVGS